MKINEKSLSKYASSGAPPDKEGHLHKRGDLNRGFQKRWFVLKGNLLFYYEKRYDKDPLGMIVVEGCTVELSDHEDGFTFMLQFPGSGTRTYVLSADTQEEMEAWMKVLSAASYDYMKVCVNELKELLKEPETDSKRRLVQSAFNERNNILQAGRLSGGAVHLKQTKSGTPKLGAVAHPKRHNPFDDDESFDNDCSLDAFSSLSVESLETRTRTFLEMHEEYRQQIDEITSLWLKNNPESFLAKFKSGVITV